MSTSRPFILRPPLLSDYETLFTWVPDAAASARWAGPGLAFPFTVTDLPARLSGPDHHSYVLTDETNSPLGFAQHWLRPTGAVHLGRIIIDPRQRGRGLGGHLCRLLMATAVRISGRKTVTLRVYRDNTAAFSIYSKLGFIPVESESNSEVLAMELKTRPVDFA